MRAVEAGGTHTTKAVTTGEPMGTFDAKELLMKMAESAWVCGDPGMQYDTLINKWNPCKATHRINASNPCSEYMFIDDSACNLASLNLMKFAREDGGFEIEKFQHAVDVVFAAQEMLVGEASYPTPAIEKNSHAFRPIGLGYANLGALLMFNGLPYDSDEGRHYAAAVTSLMHGQAYLTSAKIAAEMGPFARYPPNRDAFLEVISMHRDAAYAVEKSGVPKDLHEAQRAVWDLTLESGRQHGFRNAQATVLAPTGTIGFMMDCDTTGVEPDLALVKYKKLVGGGNDQDRQPDRPACADPPRLLGRRDARDRDLHRREGHDRGRAVSEERAPAGLRLRVQGARRHALDRPDGPRQDDVRGAALPLGRDQQDREHAERRDGRGDRGRLHAGLEDGAESHRDLPRRLQAHAAA